MRLSTRKKFGMTHVVGGRILAVKHGHPVPTKGLSEAVEIEPEDLATGKPTPGKRRFAGAKEVFCRPGDLVIEILGKAGRNLIGWSYLTGPAANLNRYASPSVRGDVYESEELPCRQYMFPLEREGAEIVDDLSIVKYQTPGVVCFNLEVVDGTPRDFATAIMELWQMAGPGAEQTCEFMGTIHAADRTQGCAALHFQTERATTPYPATPFQIDLVLGACEGKAPINGELDGKEIDTAHLDLPKIEISPDQRLRTCYRGKLTLDEAQAKIGPKCRVLELRPATTVGVDNQLVEATEIIFEPVLTVA